MTWEPRDQWLARVLAPRTIAALGPSLLAAIAKIHIPRTADDKAEQMWLPPMDEAAMRALLSDPITSKLAFLGITDSQPPLEQLARPSLTSMLLTADGDVDASRILAAAPQLRTLEIRARRSVLGSHAGLEELVLGSSTWPLHRVQLPALKRLRLSITEPIEPSALETLGACTPALEQLEIRDPIDHVLRGLRDASPLRLPNVRVTGRAESALGKELLERPGNLAELPSITVDCRGPGRRWLDCFAGDRETRAQKLATKGARWSGLFAACTEPPSPAILFDDPIAALPFSPRERALRDCGNDRAQVLVYADWLEEQGEEAMAAELRRSKLAQPLLAIQRADDLHRDSFRQTTLVLLDAWRQLSKRAPIRESTAAFRERIHLRLQNLSFRKLSKRDAASLAAVEHAIPDEQREAIGKLLRVVQILPGILAAESTEGYLVVVTDGSALIPT